MINKEMLSQHCKFGVCNIYFFLTATTEVTYRILAKSNNKLPIYLQKDYIREDSIIPMAYQYFYTDVKTGDIGEIDIKLKNNRGNILMVGKIYPKDGLPEVNADYEERVKLPTKD